MEKYRTFWRRFFAGMLDGIVFTPFIIADTVLLNPARPHAIIIGWLLFATLISWAYGVVLHAVRGQTLGKMALHVRVLDVGEGRTPTFNQALLRDLVPITMGAISTVHFIYLVVTDRYTSIFAAGDGPWQVLAYAGWLWFILEIVTMLTNKRRRALHDVIAGTVVVRTA